MRKATQKAYITKNIEGLIQSYIQHSDPLGKKFVQMLPEVLKQQSKRKNPLACVLLYETPTLNEQAHAKARPMILRPKWS